MVKLHDRLLKLQPQKYFFPVQEIRQTEGQKQPDDGDDQITGADGHADIEEGLDIAAA